MLNIAVEAALTEPERRFSSKDLARLIDLLFTGAATTATEMKRPVRRRSTFRKETRP
jgi:hypothetical protein